MTSRVRRPPSSGGTASSTGSSWRGTSPQHVMFYVLLAFLLVCLVSGGSNRTDVTSLLYLRPITVIALVVMLLVPARRDYRQVRGPLVLLGFLAVTILIQLVPLPPSLWARLPGHVSLAGASFALNGGQPWRPVTLTPDLTLNSLLALLVPATVLVGFAGIRPDQRMTLVPLTIGAAVVSAALGIAQFAAGPASTGDLYSIHSLDTPNGLFANRNHQAVFLGCALVLVAAWLRLPAPSRRHQRQRYWLAGPVACLMFVVVIATGSRSGTLLTVLALAYATATTFRGASERLSARGVTILRIAVAGTMVALVGVMLLAGRALSLGRLLGFDPEQEQRVQALPTLLTMWRDFAAVGSGFGSFDPVFRMYEPDAMLMPTYFNHAHNDWLELGITGGVPALIVLAAFIGWVGFRLARCWHIPASGAVLSARSGGIVLLMLGAASVSDYPLRTPLLAALAALACAWLADPQANQLPFRQGRAPPA